MQRASMKIWLFWCILALPALLMLAGFTGTGDFEAVLHQSGEMSARLLIISLMITPLRMIFPNLGFLRRAMRNRRYLGVAAFGYAALHTIFYLFDMASLRAILGEFFALGIWTGWLAFLIFVPLAVTSRDASIKRMGPSWKMLHRGVYIAALATLVHWIFVHNNLGPALVHFIPLAILETYRIFRFFSRQQTKTEAMT